MCTRRSSDPTTRSGLGTALARRLGDLAHLTRRRDRLGQRRIETTQTLDTRGTLPEVA
jgi:hypothetical protein